VAMLVFLFSVQGQNRLFMSHFVLPSPARTCVEDGEATTGTLATAPAWSWAGSLLKAFLAAQPRTLSSPVLLLSFPYLSCGGGQLQISRVPSGGARWGPIWRSTTEERHRGFFLYLDPEPKCGGGGQVRGVQERVPLLTLSLSITCFFDLLFCASCLLS
jgi:predicted secreted protein